MMRRQQAEILVSARRQEIAAGLRPMQNLDLFRVLEIERGAYQYPWSRGIFQDCLQAGYCCWVIEEQLQVLGYGIMQVLADEAHVLNLCIETRRQGAGFGRRLLRQLMNVAAGHYAQTMLLEVRPSNKAAIALYYSEGFAQIGRRRKYYPNHKSRSFHEGGSPREDALVLSRGLDGGFDVRFPAGVR